MGYPGDLTTSFPTSCTSRHWSFFEVLVYFLLLRVRKIYYLRFPRKRCNIKTTFKALWIQNVHSLQAQKIRWEWINILQICLLTVPCPHIPPTIAPASSAMPHTPHPDGFIVPLVSISHKQKQAKHSPRTQTSCILVRGAHSLMICLPGASGTGKANAGLGTKKCNYWSLGHKQVNEVRMSQRLARLLESLFQAALFISLINMFCVASYQVNLTAAPMKRFHVTQGVHSFMHAINILEYSLCAGYCAKSGGCQELVV